MFNIFKRQGLTNLEWMEADLHSHLLPGIDDGVGDAFTGVQFIGNLMQLGLKKFILTPHVYEEIYPNTPHTIDMAHESLYEVMQHEGLADVYTHSSAEYMLGAHFGRLLETGNLRPFPTNHVLIELPWLGEPVGLEQTLLQIRNCGYIPIIAHPERYGFYFNRKEAYHKLKELGCLLQLNLLSPTGFYGGNVMKASNYMIRNKLFDFVGTDLHHEKQLNRIVRYVRSGKAYKELAHLGLMNSTLF